jgi:hypothetical protein
MQEKDSAMQNGPSQNCQSAFSACVAASRHRSRTKKIAKKYSRDIARRRGGAWPIFSGKRRDARDTPRCAHRSIGRIKSLRDEIAIARCHLSQQDGRKLHRHGHKARRGVGRARRGDRIACVQTRLRVRQAKSADTTIKKRTISIQTWASMPKTLNF